MGLTAFPLASLAPVHLCRTCLLMMSISMALMIARSLMGNRLTVLAPGLIGEANSPNMTLFGRSVFEGCLTRLQECA